MDVPSLKARPVVRPVVSDSDVVRPVTLELVVEGSN